MYILFRSKKSFLKKYEVEAFMKIEWDGWWNNFKRYTSNIFRVTKNICDTIKSTYGWIWSIEKYYKIKSWRMKS